MQAGVKLTDIEYFLKQMYHDAAHSRTAPHDVLSFGSISIDSVTTRLRLVRILDFGIRECGLSSTTRYFAC